MRAAGLATIKRRAVAICHVLGKHLPSEVPNQVQIKSFQPIVNIRR